MTKKEEKLIAQEPDPVMKKIEEKALAEQKALEKEAKEGYLEPQAVEEMPARFRTGGATYDEKVAWVAAHGGAPEVLGVVEPGHAEPKDVAPE